MSTAAKPSISASIVGAEVGPVAHLIDARWLMAYAAGLGLTDAAYYETRDEHGPVAHPLFAVCYEWPVALEIRARTIPDEIATRSVHATHHAVIHRPPRAGDRLLTSARVVGVTRRRAGTLVTTRFTTVDERGAPVTTTDYGSVYRGVECDAEATAEPANVGAWTTRRGHRDEVAPVARDHVESAARDHTAAASATTGSGDSHMSAPVVRWTEQVDVPAWAAHVYTECARIWNPIHTDVAVATAAGLPATILHGTATLALAVSRVIARDLGGDPTHVHEVAARFTGMVLMPSTLIVRGMATATGRFAFDAVGSSRRPVLGDAWLHARVSAVH